MNFENYNDKSIFARCECGRAKTFDMSEVSIVEDKVVLNSEYKCTKCKKKYREINGFNKDLKLKPFNYNYSENVQVKENNKKVPKCPRCGAEAIFASNKGFGLGKAAIGGLLLGPIGLLGGLVGSKDVVVTCLNCGHKWKI